MPPRRDSPVDLLDRRIRELPGVRRGRSRFGGRDAYLLDGREVAHFHESDEIDLRLTRDVIRERRAALRGDPRIGFRDGRSDWLTVRLRAPEDVEFAFELFEELWRASQ